MNERNGILLTPKVKSKRNNDDSGSKKSSLTNSDSKY